MCRAALGECDLPEYCNGSSGECPRDSYKLDGTMCDRIHYCAGGRCKNPDNQCMDIYGSPARSAPEMCYVSMNTRGDRFGNCGTTSSPRLTYLKCADDNIFCGKLICTNVREIPQLKPNHTLIQVAHKDDWCWSMDAYGTADVPDDGDAHTGTLCAPHKVCMNHLCTDYTSLGYNCETTELCNGKGVCNNFRHCHCEDGYAPPDCKDPGEGGSVDSGPPRISIQLSSGGESETPKRRSYEIQGIGNVVFIVPSLLLVLLITAILFISLRTGIESVETPGGISDETTEETSSEVFIMELLPVGIQEGPEGGPPPEERPPMEAPPPAGPPLDAPPPGQPVSQEAAGEGQG